jgi:hypothetical protein
VAARDAEGGGFVSNDDTGSTEYWRDIKQARQAKRASNRDDSAQLLTEAGITFESKNDGAHLIVWIGKSASDRKINFWPGTGLWMLDNTKSKSQRNYGVKNLIQYVKGGTVR